MGQPVVLGKVPRNGSDLVEVTLSRDGVRFTATLPASIVDSDLAPAVYAAMADERCATVQQLEEITRPGGPL